MGVLADLLEQRFGVKTITNVNPVAATIAAVGDMILREHPDRLGFVFINLSVNLVYISPLPTVAVNAGILIPAGGGGVGLIWDEDFEMTSSVWYAAAAAYPSIIYVSEIVGLRSPVQKVLP